MGSSYGPEGRFLAPGYQVTVYNRPEKEKAQEVGQRGAQVAQMPTNLGARCPIVMACVRDDRAQGEVMFGPDGALAGVHGGLNTDRPGPISSSVESTRLLSSANPFWTSWVKTVSFYMGASGTGTTMERTGGQYPAWPGDASPGRRDCSG